MAYHRESDPMQEVSREDIEKKIDEMANAWAHYFDDEEMGDNLKKGSIPDPFKAKDARQFFTTNRDKVVSLFNEHDWGQVLKKARSTLSEIRKNRIARNDTRRRELFRAVDARKSKKL